MQRLPFCSLFSNFQMRSTPVWPVSSSCRTLPHRFSYVFFHPCDEDVVSPVTFRLGSPVTAQLDSIDERLSPPVLVGLKERKRPASVAK